MERPNTIEEVRGQGLRWLSVAGTSNSEMEYLDQEFHFHPLDLKDCLPPTQRPKLEVRGEYIFMILLFPVYDRLTRKIRPTEIDFFINATTVVTVHERNISPLTELFTALKAGKQQELLQNSPANLLYELLDSLTAYCFPILVHISNDIDEVEEHILDEEYYATAFRAREILRIKTNIVNFRKAVRPIKNVVERLLTVAPQFFSVARLNIFFESLVSVSREIWDSLENFKDTIDALHGSNESLLASSTNKIMKTLTVSAFIFLPAAFIVALFSTSFKVAPLMNAQGGFWIMLFGIVAVVAALVIFFKRRQWL